MNRLVSRAAGAALPLLAALPIHAQTDRAIVAYVDSVAGAAVASHRTAGVSVAVVRRGHLVVARGYGFADLENDVPATPQTVYRIGSITKQFTAASIMRLAEQGKLSLDDTLQRFLPSFPSQGHRVTLRHLLNHTSGIKSYTGLGPKWSRTMRLDLVPDSLVALFANEPFDFAPGDAWSYDNSGYFLLGMIIEKVSGKSYAQYVQDELFAPQRLTTTRYCDQPPLIKHRAQGYTILSDDRFANADLLSMTQPYAAGSLCSTVGDLATWAQQLASGQVVSAASYARMTTPDTLNGGKRLNYGFGLNVDSAFGHRHIAHNGGINGFVSELHSYPDDSLVIVVLTNTEARTASVIQRQIARRALGVPSPATVALPAADAARFAGSYQLGTQRMRYVVERGAFVMQPDGQRATPLRYVGAGRFVAADDDDVVIQFPAAGPATTVTIGTREPRSVATRLP